MRRITTLLSKLEASPNTEALAVALGDVKLQRKVSTNTLDDLFALWIQAATTYFEEGTDRQVIAATYEYALDGFPCQREIELPKPPLRSVTSITYVDGAGDEQTFDAENYSVVTPTGPYCPPGRVVLATGASWPSALCQSRSVRITFQAGYATTEAGVPSLVKACLLFLVGHFHKYGEEVQAETVTTLPLGAESMMRAFKYSAMPTTVLWQV